MMLRLAAFGFMVMGLIVAAVNTFLRPAIIRIGSETDVVVASTSSNVVGLFVTIFVSLVILAIGMGMGYALRSRGNAEKNKNEELVEKKKKRLEDAEVARTSDGDVLAVVEDEDESLR